MRWKMHSGQGSRPRWNWEYSAYAMSAAHSAKPTRFTPRRSGNRVAIGDAVISDDAANVALAQAVAGGAEAAGASPRSSRSTSSSEVWRMSLPWTM